MNHDHSGGGMGKHMLLMAICCLVPLLIIVAVGTFGLSLGPLQGLVPFVAALMCPLMMIFMMKGMMQGNGGMDHSQHHGQISRPAISSGAVDKVNPGTAEPATATSESGSSHCH